MKDSTVRKTEQAFRLKGTMPALTLLQLLTADLAAVEKQLTDHLGQMPQFFLHAPVLVDLTELGDERVDLAGLARLLRELHLVPVAIRNPNDSQQVAGVAAGWGVLQNDLAPARQAPHPRRSSRPSGAAPEGSERASTPSNSATLEPSTQETPGQDATELPLVGLTVRTPVRSGQVIRAVGGDLVVLAAVSSGAELIADGNIHVYAPLRGRALAGARGNQDVSIFCMELEAEFLSIAGRYLMAEQIEKKYRGRPTRAYLDDDGLRLVQV